jgi:hypothetical protein
VTPPTGARITSLRTKGSRRPYAAQPETITLAASLDAAQAALRRRMRRAGHDPQPEWAGISHGGLCRGATYFCPRCRYSRAVVKWGDGNKGWLIDAIPICRRMER